MSGGTTTGGVITDGVLKVYGNNWYVKCTIKASAVLAPEAALTCGKGANIEAPYGLFLGPNGLAHDFSNCNIHHNTPIYYADEGTYCTNYDDVIADSDRGPYDAPFFECVLAV
jgi:hypothetical protein